MPGRSIDPLNVDDASIYAVQTAAPGPDGSLPLTDALLRHSPSGDLFGLSQNVGLGWQPGRAADRQMLILSTQGGVRAADGTPVALGYHTGHWEIGLLVQAAAEELQRLGTIPFAGFCSDPCDGRTQGTVGMFDSLPYRNDAAMVLRRLARSLPLRSGVLGIATCDKGLPAMLMAVAGLTDLPGVIVPGGVTLPTTQGEDAGSVQMIGVRYVHGQITLEEAADLGCRACASPGGGCQFLGTAATAQVVAEALGLTLPHAALAPSGQPVWRDMAVRSARAAVMLADRGFTTRDLLTPASLRNAMVVHAAFGGSTNLLLHIPAIAHAAGLPRPSVTDWVDVNQRTPRLVSVLPNGPVHHPTVRVFLAGGVPEVMVHLDRLGLLDTSVRTVSGRTLGDVLAWWETSERRSRFRELLRERDGVDPDDVIMSPPQAKARGLRSTLAFLQGTIAPQGGVVKATAIDPSVVDADAGIGPMGTGMEETYQVTGALKQLSFGKRVALLTDARFSGVSTGACIGHVAPEGLAGGPIGRLRDGDVLCIEIDAQRCRGRVDLVGDETRRLTLEEAAAELARRSQRSDLVPDPLLPDDTRLWAMLQEASGGPWGGCVYDLERIAGGLSRAGEDTGGSSPSSGMCGSAP